MTPESAASRERLNRYLAALKEIDVGLLEKLHDVAERRHLTEGQVLALALRGLYSRAKDIEEGRMYVSVPLDSVRYYDSPDRLLLGEGNQAYGDVADVLDEEVP